MIVVKPNSEQEKISKKWIPFGIIIFLDNGSQTEHSEKYEKNKFKTKKEADQYFMQMSNKKYKV